MNTATIYNVSPEFAGKVIAEHAGEKNFSLILIDGSRVVCKVNREVDPAPGVVSVIASFVAKDQKFRNIPLATISAFKLADKSYKVFEQVIRRNRVIKEKPERRLDPRYVYSGKPGRPALAEKPVPKVFDDANFVRTGKRGRPARKIQPDA